MSVNKRRRGLCTPVFRCQENVEKPEEGTEKVSEREGVGGRECLSVGPVTLGLCGREKPNGL